MGQLPRTRATGLLVRFLLLLLGSAVGVGLLALALRGVAFDQLLTDFSKVDTLYLVLAVLPFLTIPAVKVVRWALLFGVDAPKLDTLFGAVSVGYAVNAVVPARMGELVTVYWVRDRAGISAVRTLSTIGLERVTDGLALLTLLLLTGPTVALPERLWKSGLLIGGVFVLVFAAMAAAAHAVTRESHPLSRLVRRLESGRLAPAAEMVRNAMVGLQVLRSRRAVALLLLYTVLIWASNALMTWLVVRAFHISVPLTAGALLTAVLYLGMSVPSSPGYIGVFEYLMVLTLGLYGVRHTAAVAAALGLHAIAFVPFTVIGLLYILRAGTARTLQALNPGPSRPAH